MLNKYDIKYKEFVKLRNRLDKVYELIRHLPNVKLKEPYQKGWIIKYELRDDIKNRKDINLIQEALDIGYHNSYTNNVKVVKAIRSGKTHSQLINEFGSKHGFVTFFPQRSYISHKEYLISKTLNKYIKLDEYWEEYKTKEWKRYYCDFPDYWLVLKARPNMITHKRLKGGELEQEYDYLMNKLYSSGEFHSFITNYGKSYPAYKERTKVRNKIQKFKNGEIEDIFIEKIPLDYVY